MEGTISHSASLNYQNRSADLGLQNRSTSPDTIDQPEIPDTNHHMASPDTTNHSATPGGQNDSANVEIHNQPTSSDEHNPLESLDVTNRSESPDTDDHSESPETGNPSASSDTNSHSTSLENQNDSEITENQNHPPSPEQHNQSDSPSAADHPASPDTTNHSAIPKNQNDSASLETHNQSTSSEERNPTESLDVTNQSEDPSRTDRPAGLEKNNRPADPEKQKRSAGLERLSTGGRLWIYATSFHEGLSCWRIALAEILTLAKAIGATFVEPCIHDGRLSTCAGYAEEKRVPIGDVFDLTKAFENNLMATHDDFMSLARSGTEQNRTQTFHVCMTVPRHLSGCWTDHTRWMEKKIPEIEEGIRVHERNKWVSRHTVVEIQKYWRNGLEKFQYHGKTIVSPEKQKSSYDHLRFHQRHFNRVDSLLQRANLTANNYHVVQWRAERKDLDYLTCARMIVQARDSMMAKHPLPFVLMSSVSRNIESMWGAYKHSLGDAEIRKINESLDLLLRNESFIKLDNLLEQGEQPRDQVFLAIWDLILAYKARELATCAEGGCPKKHSCFDCNYPGKFMQFAASLRDEDGKTTHKCWPTRK